MKISIVIPVFNIEQYLGRCLDSIIAQTYKNLEIIIVNDGSTDQSAEIIDAYADKDKRIIPIHISNGGVTNARLTGVKRATGEYIGFVDGDDIIEEEMYSILLENAMKYNADISHCGYQMVFPDRIDYYYNTNRFKRQDRETGLKDLLSGNFVEPGLCNKLYHKTLFERLLNDDIMDKTIRYTEDLLMNYYLFREAKKSVFIDQCYYHYMVRKSSAANKNKDINEQRLSDLLKVTKILLNETQTNACLNNILCAKYARQLISFATMNIKPNPKLLGAKREEARRELRKRVKEFLICTMDNKKLKFMIVWAAFFPHFYMLVHKIYACLTGIDKKYSID